METTHMVQRFSFLICVFTGVAAAQSAPPRKAPPRKDIPAITKAANGSVLSIVMSDKDGKPIVQGSGFFVSKDGLVVTNYHVISEGSSAVVKLPDGAFYIVDGVLASDKVRDIAVIKAHGQNFRRLTLGNSDRLQTGEEIVAIGNPLSLESTVSSGIVSGMRTVKEEGGKCLQITAPISPGSSGGPLFNMAGEVVGITTARLKGGENLNFAIPINDVKKLLAAAAAADEQWVKAFPNEPEPKETSETTHQKPTLQEQKICSEQADKILREAKRTEVAPPDMVTLSVVSHYNPSTGICYAEISRSLTVPRTSANDETYTPATRMMSDGFSRSFAIYDAFGGKEVGTFWQLLPYQNDPFAPSLCQIQPPGQPEIDCKNHKPVAEMSQAERNDLPRKCQAEFDDLAFKYFGISK